MSNDVVRFPQGSRHGWYLGPDAVVGLLPGREREWPALWAQYSRRTGRTVADLTFADEEQRAEFRCDVHEAAVTPSGRTSADPA